MIDLTKNLAAMNRRTKASVIRELLKLTNKPEIISFAGGLPAPDSFPSEQLSAAAQKVLKEMPEVALQYGATEGTPELKEQIIRMLREEEGLIVREENILITSASQQALDLIGRAFIDPSDPILVELPSYLGAMQVFKSYGAKMIGVESDEHGITITDLEKKLRKLKNEEEHYKFIYMVPDFQNPSGRTIPQERREQIIRLANEYEVIIIEDSPYRQIRFEGTAPDTLYKLDMNGNVISLFTFSKTLAPGLRLGVILCNPTIKRKFEILKQSLDLCTSSFNQLIAAEFLRSNYIEGHLKNVNSVYKKKKDAMLAALSRYMPGGVTWTKPEGGLFLWLELPKEMDADELFYEAIKQNVAYVIGSAFHCDDGGKNTMRLNFSYATYEQIDEGIRRLAEVIKANWPKH